MLFQTQKKSDRQAIHKAQQEAMEANGVLVENLMKVMPADMRDSMLASHYRNDLPTVANRLEDWNASEDNPDNDNRGASPTTKGWRNMIVPAGVTAIGAATSFVPAIALGAAGSAVAIYKARQAYQHESYEQRVGPAAERLAEAMTGYENRSDKEIVATIRDRAEDYRNVTGNAPESSGMYRLMRPWEVSQALANRDRDEMQEMVQAAYSKACEAGVGDKFMAGISQIDGQAKTDFCQQIQRTSSPADTVQAMDQAFNPGDMRADMKAFRDEMDQDRPAPNAPKFG